MSLIRRTWILLSITLVLALGAGAALNIASARAALEQALTAKNNDSAGELALVLSQRKGEPAAASVMLATQFESGRFQRLIYSGSGAHPVYSIEAPEHPRRAPFWFVQLVALKGQPGVAAVSDGERPAGLLEVVSESGTAYDALWSTSLSTLGALGAIGAALLMLAAWQMNGVRRRVDFAVAQAQALDRGEYRIAPESDLIELRPMTRAMNTMVARLRSVYEAQAAQVETLRRQADCDPLTGLSNRSHFMNQLSASLQREDATAEGGLVLLRLLSLADVNRSLGHAATDRLIDSIAQALKTYSRRVEGCFIGRLNGSDFALRLPAGGVALETATALAASLSTLLPGFGANLAVAAGAVELRRGSTVAQVMGAADLALARAESRGAFAVEPEAEGQAQLSALGQGAWRERIRDALADPARARLGSFPLADARGQLIHLECPLRLQIEPDGAFEVAARWLPLAVRSRLTPQADERALTLAMAEIARDGLPRCVNLAPASLADPEYALRLRLHLMQAPAVACKLWLEVSEIAAFEHLERVRDLGRQIRPVGARLGLEHAGERLGRMARLFEVGLDYVKLDAAITHGIAAESGRVGFVEGLATMLHGLSLQVYAEGVASEQEAQALWACGVDGLTGPWLGAHVTPS